MRVLPQGDVIISWPIRVMVLFVLATSWVAFLFGLAVLYVAEEFMPFSWASGLALGIAISVFVIVVFLFPYRFEFTKERITLRRLFASDNRFDISEYKSIQIHSRHKMTLHFTDRALGIDLRLFGRRDRSRVLDYVIEMHERPKPKPMPSTSTG